MSDTMNHVHHRGEPRGGTTTRSGRRPTVLLGMRENPVRLLAVLALLLVGVLWAPSAHALPPDGAGSDTPGTSSRVSPSTVSPGDTIQWSVSGFPAGETLSIKIDDGAGYSNTTVQGSGVVAQATISADGTASGFLRIPDDISAGAHWLRYLASRVVTTGGGGTEGYTNRGNSDFTVVAASSDSTGQGSTTGSTTGGSSNSSTTGGTSGGSGATTGTDGAATQAGEGEVLTLDPSSVPSTSSSPSVSSDTSATTAAQSDSRGSESTTSAQALASASESSGSSVPIVGIVGAAVILLLGAGLAVWILRPSRARVAVGEDGAQGESSERG